jgi:hypothetical protein
MLKSLRIGIIMLVVCWSHFNSLRAQSSSEKYAKTESGKSEPAQSQDIAHDSDYRLRSGTNEFTFWGGGAFHSTTGFGGLHKDEASGRKFLIAALRYGRTLSANSSVALQYTLDIIPLALATNNVTRETIVASPGGPVVNFQRGSVYGGGAAPLGFQLTFRNSSRVKPFVHVNAGVLFFAKPMPLPDAGRVAFTLEGGGGVRFFSIFRRAVTVGVRLHHISNANLSGSNRGLNQFVTYVGYSFFK